MILIGKASDYRITSMVTADGTAALGIQWVLGGDYWISHRRWYIGFKQRGVQLSVLGTAGKESVGKEILPVFAQPSANVVTNIKII
jgi:hypothetical protein